ncbi:MAG: hypothetical protein KME19_05685 [Microcoleus vaginatus WJT46-NPBG5]|jgi:hypothetical protein|nr:hypothetical protein [Microcoleus vaginatus WJT46-NPBG5]
MTLSFWNLLHDGTIAKIAAPRHDTRLLTIEIEYLRHMFSKDGNAIIIQLDNCDVFEYQDYQNFINEERTQELLTIATYEPEILSATQNQNNIITIVCVAGLVRTRYQSFSLTLDNEYPITLENLKNAYQRYWEAFGNKNTLRE